MESFISDFVAGLLQDFMESVNSVISILGMDLQSNKQMWGLVLNVQNIVKPTCYTIISIFFLVEFLKMSLRMDVIKWEFLFKILIKFAIAKSCIDFAPKIFEAIYSTIAEWIQTFGTGAYDESFYADIADKLNDVLLNMGFWEMIGFAVTCIIPCLVLLVCSFIIKVIAYGRMIELYILLAVMPIPFSMILDGEGHSNSTKKYLLNFAGVCLQGFLIVIACSLYQYFMSDIITKQYNEIMAGSNASATDLLFTLVLGAIVMVLAVTKCSQWGKQALNAL